MMDKAFSLSSNLVDVLHERIYPATLSVLDGRILEIIPEKRLQPTYLLPGFIDAHIHIESSMLPPAEFARAAVRYGTIAAVADPHEIANVLGVAGVHYMIDDSKRTPFKFSFGVPSCVPATPFETAGGRLTVDEIDALLALPEVRHLSEVMNYPAVLGSDPDVMAMLHAATRRGKRIDGHAPGLRGAELRAYAGAGISSDHESTNLDEAREKIRCGMKALIREGSAAKNLAALLPLLDEFPESCMFCCDDLHPDDLLHGHIDRLVRAACAGGVELMRVLRCACVNPVKHYQLDVGLLQTGDAADFIEVDNLQQLTVLRTWIHGRLVARQGESLLPRLPVTPANHFAAVPMAPDDFAVKAVDGRLRVIQVLEHQLLTEMRLRRPTVAHGQAVADPLRDLLKITVLNRYQPSPPAVGFISGVGLREGAIASSIAHDSHNIIGVGASDADLCAAVNAVIDMRGGLAVVNGPSCTTFPLPIAGLMSDESHDTVAANYSAVDQAAKALGTPLQNPFMTLSFMALLVIPRIKMSDRGLFDAENFAFLDLFERDQPA